MSKWRNIKGQYAFVDNWERLCICGHKLGVHAGENDTGKRPCFNEDSGMEDATGEPCDCKHFKLEAKG